MANSNYGTASPLKVVSFNMHDFHQDLSAVERIIETESLDISMLQEHWLTPLNLSNFDIHFNNYSSFVSSAMSSRVESGMRYGRPFGEVIILISKHSRGSTSTVYCDERFAVVKVLDYLSVNVYLPCSGTVNRLSLYEDIMADINHQSIY